MMQAYVLVQTEMAQSAKVATRLAQIEGVTAANEVTGPYDVIATVQAPDVVVLGRDVLAKVQAVEGITRTITCPVVSLG
jgi:DNA-binding Lrp family transcriptional regulator